MGTFNESGKWPTFTGRYAHTSRGKHYAKHQQSGAWAQRPSDSTDDVLVLDQPGKWGVGSTDGFNRKEWYYVIVTEDGKIEG